MGNQPVSQYQQKELQKQFAKFEQLQQDPKADLNPNQILNIPQLNKNPLVERFISIFDKNKDNSISFSEFVGAIGALYSKDEEARMKFAFKIYDADENGYITNSELYKVLKHMTGDNLTDFQLHQLVDRTIIKADLDADGKISYEEFKNIVKGMDQIKY